MLVKCYITQKCNVQILLVLALKHIVYNKSNNFLVTHNNEG